MNLLTLMSPTAGMPDQFDDWWYNPITTSSVSGQRVTFDRAMQSSVVYGCATAIADDIARLPLPLYRELPDGGREPAKDDQRFWLLRQPNLYQTGHEWKRMVVWHILFRGDHFSRIMPGEEGPFSALLPIHPDRVTVELLTNGALRYVVKSDRPGQPDENLTQAEVFHVPGPSEDGITGKSVLECAREAIGAGLAMEEYVARLFNQGARPGGVLEMPGTLSEPARKALGASWDAAHSGGNAGKTAVLESDMKWHQIGMTSVDAQFLESSKSNKEDIARYFRMPHHKVGIMEAATFSNIEHQAIEYVTDTLGPWMSRIEQRITMQLIAPEEPLYAEFLVEALLRGDVKSTNEAFGISIDKGFMNRQEVRRKLNLNPGPDDLEEFLVPRNMRRSDEPTPQKAAVEPKQIAAATPFAERLAAIVVRKEIARIKALAKRHADDQDAFLTAVEGFYESHAADVGNKLGMGAETARRWCDEQRDAVMYHGIAAVETWEQDRPAALAALTEEAA